MPSQLCLTVRFLNREFHGRSDGGEPEWPPSPMRLFQALVAAAHAKWKQDEVELNRAVAPLMWLECQPAPVIVAPTGRPSQPFRLSVPNNAMDIVARAWERGNETGKDANPATHRAMKMVEGTTLIDGDAVHFLWPLDESPNDSVLAIIESLMMTVQSLVALGWGIDMVVGHGRVLSDVESAQLTGERWVPLSRGGGSGLRVPASGSLSALQSRHQRFLQRITPDGGFDPVPDLPPTAYRKIGYSREHDRPQRPFAAFQLLHAQEQRFRSFRITQTVKVAAMVRHVVAEVTQETQHSEPGVDPAQWLDVYVHGHNRTNETTLGRFSYLPLPTIDPRDVASGIRRVLVAEPMDGLGEHVAWARRMVAGQPLVNEATQAIEAFLAPLPEGDSVLRRYITRSRDWATVTPVVLPWGDDGSRRRAENQFFKALRHAGYSADELEDFELRREPFWRGADVALRYFVPEKLRLRGTARWHVRLKWKQEIPGPLALGSGRFCGLGLFAAIVP